MSKLPFSVYDTFAYLASGLIVAIATDYAFALGLRREGASVVETIFDSIEKVIPFPRIGRVVTEVGDDTVRELLFRTFRIVYKVTAEGIVVLGILYGGRPSDRREPRRWEIY